MSFVVIDNNLLTEKTKAGQEPALFNSTQSILRVNRGNEEILKDFIKYSSEEILGLDNTRQARSTVFPKDESNRSFTRLAITQEGWAFLAHFVEAKTSTIDSIYCEDHNGNKEPQHYCKFYNADGLVLTSQSEIDTECVRSVFTIIIGFDFEIVCGEIHQYERPTTDIRMHSLMGAFMPDGTPISVKPFVKNLNMKFKDKAKAIMTDGRAPKLLRKEFAGLPFDANQIQIIVNHEAGVKHEFMVELEYYRE